MDKQVEIDHKICVHIQKLARDAEKTSASNFAVAQRWGRWNGGLGLGVVILSASVSALGAASASKSVVAEPDLQSQLILLSTIISSVAAVLGSILTFLKPSELAAHYREFGNKQKALCNRLRVYHTVSIAFTADPDQRHNALRDFLTEKDALNSDNPEIPRWAFTQASKDIAAKPQQQANEESARTES